MTNSRSRILSKYHIKAVYFALLPTSLLLLDLVSLLQLTLDAMLLFLGKLV